MADVEEPRYTTLAERIAALNQQKNFQAPPTNAGAKRPPPPPPGRPASQARSQTAPVPEQQSPRLPARPSVKEAPPLLPRRTTIAVEESETRSPPVPSRVLPPPLPTRSSSQQLSPALPPRRPSTQQNSIRRNSNESEISLASTVSALSLKHMSSATSVGSGESQPPRKLPPTLDHAKLPPLPPTRRELEARAKEAAAKEAVTQVKAAPAVRRAMEAAPRLPSRPTQVPAEPAPVLPARRLPPPPASYVKPKSALDSGFGSRHARDDSPPPVPLASRPTFAQIDAAARVPPPIPQGDVCLVCRDFSAPDAVAAQYPIASLPRRDVVGYLAHHLCSPFPSATDKARAIFTWCHHNIAYDVDGFFGGCIPRGQSDEERIFSGKAVCEGYARIFESIATRAGLECFFVVGHGKGFSHAPTFPGDPVPPWDSNHAWNSVKIDNGEWKLLDACWGAGNVCTKRAERYEKKFVPTMFTMDNEDFGQKHFPEDSRHFYRKDRRNPSWAEYAVEAGGPRATLFSNARDEGINEETMAPRNKIIPVHSGDVVRFQFGKLCPHWTSEKNGSGKKPYLLMMKIFGVDGRKEDLVPMDSDGFWSYVDIPARDLGAPGQTIFCYALDTLDGRDARGVSKQEFLSKKGRCGMSWVGIGSWELA